MEEAVFLAAALVAEILGTLAGFGSSTILLPFAFILFDVPTALVLVGIYHIFGNIGRMVFFRHGLQWRLIFIFGVPSLVFAIAGAILVGLVPSGILTFFFGCVMIAYVAISIFEEKEKRLKPTDGNAAIGGGVSGFIAGLIGTGGPFRAAFLHAFAIPKNMFIATSAAVAMTADIPRVGVYLAQGYLQPRHMAMLPLLVGIALGGTYIGKFVVERISTRVFHKIVLGGLFGAGFYFVVKGVQYLLVIDVL